MNARFLLGRLVVALLILSGSVFAVPGTSDAADSGPRRSSSAIALTPEGRTLLVVNPDSNSLSVVDVADGTVDEVGVGVDPRTVAVDSKGERAYIANRGSDSVSVVDLAAGTVVTDVVTGDRPYGVVISPDGERLYVAEQGADRVRVLDTSSLETVALLPVADRPSGLAVTDGGKVYVTHLLANTITVIGQSTFSVYLPLVIKGGGQESGVAHLYTVPQRPARLEAERILATIELFPGSGLAQSIVLSPDGGRVYVALTRANAKNPNLTFDTTVFPMVSVIDTGTDAHLSEQNLALDTIDPPGVGLPFDVGFGPAGDEIWVLNAASNDITVVDLDARQRVAHIEVGDNPRGIVMAPDGSRAYVNNTLAGTVSVLDTAAYTVTETITVTEIPLPPVLLTGKRLFHTSDDPRLARDQWIACNTCHYEGEHDGQTWLFGFAGPRNTTSLLGMIETYPLRWSGEWDESADSEFANRRENFGSGLIEGEMNCTAFPADCVHHPPNQGLSADLDALAAFIDSLQVLPSPGHDQGQPLTESEKRGQELFLDPPLGCVECHPPPLYTDLKLHDVGTATSDEKIGPEYDTPTLRGLYDSAPYFHDGSAETLYDTLTRASEGSEHDLSGLLTASEIQDLMAFLMILPFE